MDVVFKISSLTILLLLMQILSLSFGHPQCLDGKPPFKPVGGLEFCSEYTDFGCCTRDEERKIIAR